MAVDEAPWVTKKVVVGLMALTFLLCWCADELKCKSGRTSWCFGPLANTCDRASCQDVVFGKHGREGDYVEPHRVNEAVLLVHVLEVGPPISRPAKPTVPSAGMEDEGGSLGNAVLNALQDRWRRTQALGVGDISQSLFKGSLVCPLTRDTHLQHVFKPHPSTSILWGSDRFPFPALDLVDRDRLWLTDVKDTLPPVHSRSSMQKHFPGLHKSLNDALKGGDVGVRYDRVMGVLFFLVVSPGLDPARIRSHLPEDMASTIMEGHAVVRATVTRYLNQKRRYSNHLDTVWYVSLPFAFPAHSFEGVEGVEEVRRPLSAVPALLLSNHSETFCTQFCDSVAVGGQVPSTCSATCLKWYGRSEAMREASLQLQRLLQTKATQWPTRRACVTPYRECYYQVVHDSLSQNRTLFTDAFILNESGLKSFAECLVSL